MWGCKLSKAGASSAVWLLMTGLAWVSRLRVPGQFPAQVIASLVFRCLLPCVRAQRGSKAHQAERWFAQQPKRSSSPPTWPTSPCGSSSCGSLPGESSCCADSVLVLTLGKERAESSQMLLASPAQTQSTQQENIGLLGVLWRTCNAWIIFVCSSGAKWTDPNPAHSNVRCCILLWLNKLLLTTAPSHPGGSLCSAGGGAAAQGSAKLRALKKLCVELCALAVPRVWRLRTQAVCLSLV